jgi:hypothetical protein
MKYIFIALCLLGCSTTAPPEPHRYGEVPVPQGSAGPCDAGPGVVCGMYPHTLTLTTSPLHRITVLEGNGDGGYQFADASFGGGSSGIDAATSYPLVGNGTAGLPITERLCDAGQWHVMGDAGSYYCGNVVGSAGIDAATTAPISGNGTPSHPIALTGTVSIGHGGTGTSLGCSSGQVVQAASSIALECNGEVTISDAGAIAWSSSATSPSLSQASTSNATPETFTITPQYSTNANPNGSSAYTELHGASGSGVDGYWGATYNGNPLIAFSNGTGISGLGASSATLWMLPGGGTPSGSNFIISNDQNLFTQIYGGAYGTTIGTSSGATFSVFESAPWATTAAGVSFGVGVGSSFSSEAGATNALAFATGGSTPTSTPGDPLCLASGATGAPGGIVCYDSVGGHISLSGTILDFEPNTSAGSYGVAISADGTSELGFGVASSGSPAAALPYLSVSAELYATAPQSISVSGGSTVTLSTSQCASPLLTMTGSATATTTLVFSNCIAGGIYQLSTAGLTTSSGVLLQASNGSSGNVTLGTTTGTTPTRVFTIVLPTANQIATSGGAF